MSKFSRRAVTLRAEGIDVHTAYDGTSTSVHQLHDSDTPAVALSGQSMRAAVLARVLRDDAWSEGRRKLPDVERCILIEMLVDLTEEIRTLAQLNEQHENRLLAVKGVSHE